MQVPECRTKEHLESSDYGLIQQAQHGDQEAFEMLVRRYHHTLFNLIYHYVKEYHDACDVLQQVLLQFYLSLAILRAGKPLKGWLFQVARSRSIDHLRRKRPAYFSELEIDVEEVEGHALVPLADTSPLPEEVVEQREGEHRLWGAIQALPSPYRQIVSLRCTTQLSFCEIGRVLHIPESTARTYFHRARLLLRTALEA